MEKLADDIIDPKYFQKGAKESQQLQKGKNILDVKASASSTTFVNSAEN